MPIKLYFFNIHTHSSFSAKNEIAVKNLFPEQYKIIEQNPVNLYSVGIHPWFSDNINRDILVNKLREISKFENFVAIGEVGVDKKRGASQEIQINLFEAQACIANEINKPLIIHCVKASNEILTLRRKLKPTVNWIFHGFRQNAEIAKKCIDLGCKLSFGKALLENGSSLQRLFKSIPNEMFFLETDDAGSIEEIYTIASRLKEMPLSELQNRLWLNFKESFNVQQNGYLQQLETAYRIANRSQ